MSFKANAQVSNTGCVGYNFGIDAGLYSNIIEFGTGTPAAGSKDWFFSPGAGLGIIDESDSAALRTLLQTAANPTYEQRLNVPLSTIVGGQILIDGVFGRDHFGGTGGTDLTSYTSASKNGEDPAIWACGPSNVLGKNDIIDVSGHMFREGDEMTDHLWFTGIINRAEPGGDAYMDFEFYIEKIEFTPGVGFNSGGPDLGHTAFRFASDPEPDGSYKITKVGDFIYNCQLTGGGINPAVEVRLWVSRADWVANKRPAEFTYGGLFDGAYNNAPYGYANIIPVSSNLAICAKVNTAGEIPNAPPWGTKNTKTNVYGTTYQEYSILEVGLNMTEIGIDHASLLGLDPCDFPIHTFIAKTRASNSFTAQLKDFAGPYGWAQVNHAGIIIGNTLFDCYSPTAQITISPYRDDITYSWSTIDGEIEGDPTNDTITILKPGTYKLESTLLFNGCPIEDTYVTVGYDPTKPLFGNFSHTSQVSCSGNDGSINLTVTGGTAPYNYIWDDPGAQTTATPSGLAPGTYTVTVTDDIGCEKTYSATVGTRVPTDITLTPTHITCFGFFNGSIDATVTGQSPFTYNWSNGAGTEDVNGLVAGTYTVTTTDADGCTETEDVQVNQPPVLSLSATKTNDTDPSPVGNGSIDLTVSGGTPDYTYLWSNAETTQDLADLTAGTYTVTVTDDNGCTAVYSTIIYEPEVCDDGIDNDGDGLTDCFDPDCIASNPGVISASENPVCVGDVGITYTVDDILGYSFNWTVPAGASITSGSGTNEITVTWISNIGGQICVRAVTPFGCISAQQSCFSATVQDTPAGTSTITKTP